MKRIAWTALAAILTSCVSQHPQSGRHVSELLDEVAAGNEEAAGELTNRGETVLPYVQQAMEQRSSVLLQDVFHKIYWGFGVPIRGGPKEVRRGTMVRSIPSYSATRSGDSVVVHEQEDQSHFARCRRVKDGSFVWEAKVPEIYGICLNLGRVLVLGESSLEVRDLASGERLWFLTVNYNLWLNCVSTAAGIFIPGPKSDNWICLDWSSGANLWDVPHTVRSAITLPDGDVVVATTGAAERYDSKGRCVWRRPWKEKIHPVPFVLVGNVLVAASRGRNQEHEVLCLDASTGYVLWGMTGREAEAVAGSPDKKAIYISSAAHDSDGEVLCIDTSSWSTRWKRKATALSLAANDREVFVGDWKRNSEATDVRCLSADGGDHRWVATVAGPPLPEDSVSGPLQYPVPRLELRGNHLLVVLGGSGGTKTFCFDVVAGKTHFEWPR